MFEKLTPDRCFFSILFENAGPKMQRGKDFFSPRNDFQLFLPPAFYHGVFCSWTRLIQLRYEYWTSEIQIQPKLNIKIQNHLNYWLVLIHNWNGLLFTSLVAKATRHLKSAIQTVSEFQPFLFLNSSGGLNTVPL